jgi:hypothetical protein
MRLASLPIPLFVLGTSLASSLAQADAELDAGPTLVASAPAPAPVPATATPSPATRAPTAPLPFWKTPSKEASGFSLGVNSPIGWAAGGFGTSLSFGFRDHHAIRLNVASYAHRTPLLSEEITYGGRTTDVGVGWVLYPRSLWSGLTLELGALVRSAELSENDTFDEVMVKRDTTTFAARALAGWTWRLGYYAFVSAAVGLSAGVERGDASSQRYMEEKVTSTVDDGAVKGEAYLRMGFAYGG